MSITVDRERTNLLSLTYNVNVDGFRLVTTQAIPRFARISTGAQAGDPSQNQRIAFHVNAVATITDKLLTLSRESA